MQTKIPAPGPQIVVGVAEAIHHTRKHEQHTFPPHATHNTRPHLCHCWWNGLDAGNTQNLVAGCELLGREAHMLPNTCCFTMAAWAEKSFDGE